jgi:hypothetical protein
MLTIEAAIDIQHQRTKDGSHDKEYEWITNKRRIKRWVEGWSVACGPIPCEPLRVAKIHVEEGFSNKEKRWRTISDGDQDTCNGYEIK